MTTLREMLALSPLNNTFPALHGLRVVAILTVLQIHVTSAMVGSRGVITIDLPSSIADTSLLIWFGMDMFFILSGFLIGTMLIRGDRFLERGKLARFYIRRSFRIFPLYYVVLTLFVLFLPVDPIQRQNILWEYLYLTNYQATYAVVMPWAWSLAVEEHFYISVPLLIGALLWLRSDRLRLTAIVLAWGGGLAARCWFYFVTHAGEISYGELWLSAYFQTHLRFDILLAGIFIAYTHHEHGDMIRTWLERRSIRLAFWSISSLSLVFILNKPTQEPWLGPWCLLAWGTMTSIMYVPLILMLLCRPEGWIARVLGHRFLLPLATLGYGVYLVHIPMMRYAVLPLAKWATDGGVPLGMVWWASLALLFIGSLSVAYVLHITVEKSALWLRDRVAP
ncbi:MAG: acyltransferase [Proteobacteria bacterium]|nr:acyltransferase [Pseudomonadota bacterium]